MRKKKTIILATLIFVLAVAGFIGGWLLMNPQTETAGNKLGVAWYDEEGTEFVISTTDELYDLMKLSEFYNFKDQTIKLGADIVVNDGSAADWEKKSPSRKWYPITGFAGTFDGQGHTISGLYGYGVDYAMGLFADTETSCKIMDFKILNSYFKVSGNAPVGSIASNGSGTFEKIYSDAIISSNGENSGGIIGVVNKGGTETKSGKNTKIVNCWFDGEVRLTTKAGRLSGGIVGLINGGTSNIQHCLNSGTISSEAETASGLYIGGIVGRLIYENYGGTAYVTDCLNTGKLETRIMTGTGAIIGGTSSKTTLALSDTYILLGKLTLCNKTSGTVTGGAPMIDPEMIAGPKWYSYTTLDFNKYWALTDDTPILQYFAEEVPDVSGLVKAYNFDWFNENRSENVIYTAEDLYGFALLSQESTFENCVISLGNDIVMNEGKAENWEKEAPEKMWIPIAGGLGNAQMFKGVFDGQGYTISGLYMRTSNMGSGLFAGTTKESVIQNLRLTNSYFEYIGDVGTNAIIGSVVGRGNGDIKNIYSDAIVKSSGVINGGIVGQIIYAGIHTVSNCWFDGILEMTGEGATGAKQGGGIVGRIQKGTVNMEHCLNTGTISCEASDAAINVAGLCGYIMNGEENMVLNITDSLNAGKVSTQHNVGVGSIVGRVREETTVNIIETYVLEGSCSINKEGKISEPATIGYSKGTVNGAAVYKPKEEISGYEAYRWTNLDFAKYWAVVLTDTPILKSFATKVPSVAGIKKMFDTSWYDANKKIFVLKDREDLYGFTHLVSAGINFKDKTVCLGADIVVNAGTASEWAQGVNIPSLKWAPIGKKAAFEGTFDGQGHTISGLYGTAKSNYMGLFGWTGEHSTIKNLRLTNSYFEMTDNKHRIGSIAGRGEGTFHTIYSDAIVTCSGQLNGGIVGYKAGETSSSIVNCWYAGTIHMVGDASKYTGGIVGRIQNGKLTVDNCLFTGTILIGGAKRSASTGGLCGMATYDLTIKNCLNAGVIKLAEATGMNSVSRVIGQIENKEESKVTVENVYFTMEGLNSGSRWYCAGDLATIKGGAEAKPKEDITGYNGFRTTALDFENYWAVVLAETSGADGTPVLKSFASSTPSVAGIDRIFDISWYKEKKTSYVLNDKEDLYGFAYLCNSGINFKGKTVKLGKNITVNTKGNAEDWSKGINIPDYRWTPASKNAAFEGTFDGNAKTISGLYGTTNSSYMGFFGWTGKDSIVKNLSIKNSYFESTVTGAARIGSVAGRGEGAFHTIYSDAIIASYGQANGGIVGHKTLESKTSFTNCWYAGTIHMYKDSSKYTGGILGRTEKSEITIDNCLFSGVISIGGSTRSSSTGGFVGMADYKLSISNSLNSGTFEFKEATKMNSVGRVIGQVANSNKANVELDDVYYTTVGKSATSKWYCAGNKPTIKGTPEKIAEKDILGYLAYFHTTLNFDEYWTFVIDKEATLTENEASTPILKSFAKTKPSLPALSSNADISWYDKEKDTYTLDSTEDFRGFGYLSSIGMNFEGKTVNLTADVTLNTGTVSDIWEKWTPIGSAANEFAGEFNGNNHNIKGVYVDTDKPGAGLFGGTAEGSVIKNFKLKNSCIKSTATYAGSVVGSLSGDMENVYSSADVEFTNLHVGGLVGQIWTEESVSMSQCWFDGSMSVKRNAGGLVGKISQGSVRITDCLNTTAIPSTGDFIGGLVGRVILSANEWDTDNEGGSVSVVVTNSLNIGKIADSSKTRVGSIVGQLAGKTEAEFVNVYTTNESYVNTAGDTPQSKAVGSKSGSATVTGNVNMCSITDITVSDTVTEKMVWDELEALNSKTIWAIGSVGTPVLQWATDLHYSTAWYNETDTTYTISTAKELYGLSYLASQGVNFAGKTIRLDADITLNAGEVSTWNKETGEGLIKWIPIGLPDCEFAGTFDGKEHSIKGLYVSVTEEGAGLFGGTADSSVIKNLKLENSYITSTVGRLGSIVGSLSGDMVNVYSSAEVVSQGASVGGLVGQIWSEENVSMSQCWFDGSMTVKSSAGGLVGRISQGEVTMTDCLNTATITCTGDFSGGIVGRVVRSDKEWEYDEKGAASVVVTNSLNIGTITHSNKTRVGSVFGQVAGKTEAEFVNVYTTYESYVYTADNTSKAIGSQSSSATVTGDINMRNDYKLIISDTVTEEAVKTQLAELDFENTWGIGASKKPELQWVHALYADTSWYDKSENSFTLTTAKQLYGLSYLCKKGTDFTGKTINLGADITVNDGIVETWVTNSFAGLKEWRPIGTPDNEFAGIFDGNGYSIKGLYVNTDEQGAGLFGGTAEGSVIKNLKLENSYITSTSTYVGSIVGSLSGDMKNVYSSAIVVTNSNYVGGLAGQIWSKQSVNMSQCWFDGSMNVKGNAGGLVGKVSQGKVAMTDCLNTATITCTGDFNGGLVGRIVRSDKEWEIHESGEVSIIVTKSLNIGTVTHSNKTRVGSVFGQIAGSTEVKFVNVYTTNESYIYTADNTSKAIGSQAGSATVTGDVNMLSEDSITASGTVTEEAVKKALKGLDFTNVWMLGAKGTPELK